MLLTRESILEMKDLETKVVEVPKWGSVTLKELTGAQRDEWETTCASRMGANGQMKSSKDLRAKLVSMSIVCENGELMFSAKDVQSLSQKSAKALDFLVSEINSFNGLDSDDAVDAAEGN